MHAIIAGANKSGTTSLFRYLADHPQVAPSREKETDFFLTAHDDDTNAARERYAALFVGRERAKVSLEASPAYLRGGRIVAERIVQTLSDARLIFLLREPVSRLVSYLRANAQNQYKPDVAQLSDEGYVLLVESIASGDEPTAPGPARNAFLQFERGCYARYLQQYLEFFRNDEVAILFFDDLRRDAQATTRAVCAFLGIDPGFYDGYSFVVENRTRRHRSAVLQRTLTRINARLEPLLNRYPVVRKGLRRSYELVNERPVARSAESGLDEGLRARLEELYRPHNAALRVLLSRHYPHLVQPAWVRS